jgi:hypothetical protein
MGPLSKTNEQHFLLKEKAIRRQEFLNGSQVLGSMISSFIVKELKVN